MEDYKRFWSTLDEAVMWGDIRFVRQLFEYQNDELDDDLLFPPDSSEITSKTDVTVGESYLVWFDFYENGPTYEVLRVVGKRKGHKGDIIVKSIGKSGYSYRLYYSNGVYGRGSGHDRPFIIREATLEDIEKMKRCYGDDDDGDGDGDGDGNHSSHTSDGDSDGDGDGDGDGNSSSDGDGDGDGNSNSDGDGDGDGDDRCLITTSNEK